MSTSSNYNKVESSSSKFILLKILLIINAVPLKQSLTIFFENLLKSTGLSENYVSRFYVYNLCTSLRDVTWRKLITLLTHEFKYKNKNKTQSYTHKQIRTSISLSTIGQALTEGGIIIINIFKGCETFLFIKIFKYICMQFLC